MPPSSLESRGLFGNAVTGYHLAWVHRRQLLAVLLPILAPALLGLLLLNLFPGRDQALIINGDELVPLESTNAAPESGALAVAGSRIYATAATSTTRPSGFHISYGTSEEHWQQTLWICERTRCQRHPLDVFQKPSGPEMLAVGPDGRVLIVRNDRITLTTPPETD